MKGADLKLAKEKRGHGFKCPLFAICVAIAIVAITYAIIMLVNTYGAEALFILTLVIIGMVFGLCIRWLYKDGRLRLSHIIVLWIMLSGTGIMCGTLFLADAGKQQIAESLAATVASTMIAEAIGYAAGSAVEHVTQNISQNRIVSVDNPNYSSDTNGTDIDAASSMLANIDQFTEESDDGSVG